MYEKILDLKVEEIAFFTLINRKLIIRLKQVLMPHKSNSEILYTNKVSDYQTSWTGL